MGGIFAYLQAGVPIIPGKMLIGIMMTNGMTASLGGSGRIPRSGYCRACFRRQMFIHKKKRALNDIGGFFIPFLHSLEMFEFLF